jgi:hypothetical protein
MKKITVKCYNEGYATLTTSDFHIENENNATQLEIDYSGTTLKDKEKWVDLIMSDGTSLRYDLGFDEIVLLSLEYPTTIKGFMTITPMIYDGLEKHKFKTNAKVMIYEQPEAGSSEAIARDDFIFQLKLQVDEWGSKKKHFAQLAEGETFDYTLLLGYSIVIFQFRDPVSGRIEEATFIAKPEIDAMNIIKEIKKSPLRFAKVELIDDVFRFDVFNDLGLSDRIGAVLDIFGIYLREEI